MRGVILFLGGEYNPLDVPYPFYGGVDPCQNGSGGVNCGGHPLRIGKDTSPFYTPCISLSLYLSLYLSLSLSLSLSLYLYLIYFLNIMSIHNPFIFLIFVYLRLKLSV